MAQWIFATTQTNIFAYVSPIKGNDIELVDSYKHSGHVINSEFDDLTLKILLLYARTVPSNLTCLAITVRDPQQFTPTTLSLTSSSWLGMQPHIFFNLALLVASIRTYSWYCNLWDFICTSDVAGQTVCMRRYNFSVIMSERIDMCH